MPAEDSYRKIMSFMTLCLTILLNIYHGVTSAGMSHADAATETQGDRYTDSVIVEFDPAG